MTQPVSPEVLPVPPGKSGCPINMTMELLGDRWSLIVLRDIMFSGNTHFRELLGASMEGIASNMLAARLSKLVDAGLLSRDDDPSHRQKVEYHLTEAAIQLVPLITELGAWGARWMPTTPELAIRARLLAEGGPTLRTRFMDELRDIHLRRQGTPDRGVLAELTAAYLEVAGHSGTQAGGGGSEDRVGIGEGESARTD
ncbi:winged helix-turn-helix transcriptional regulator [Nocardia sp. NPDC003963]